MRKLYLRSDTAGYQQDLLKYCAEGRNERFGMIEFAVVADVTAEFKQAVAELPETAWQGLDRLVDGERYASDQQRAGHLQRQEARKRLYWHEFGLRTGSRVLF